MEARNCKLLLRKCGGRASGKQEARQRRRSRTGVTCGARERPQRQPIAGSPSPVLPAPPEAHLALPVYLHSSRGARGRDLRAAAVGAGGRRRRDHGGGGRPAMCEACDARGGSGDRGRRPLHLPAKESDLRRPRHRILPRAMALA
ncbi:hypothetical protein SETIT_5G395600v2 [Setaria italica]|uniref:Uncharacterized protein n=2 Tax=Setaria TaxID=4554 RepID=A0A368RDV7_SETIT|nr:hypothetical protein SETIT_5G395600v2 [Setaria italica]TKW17931.1 hypothetical protein SEVIR_5G401100v2 [Setaria viridis]